MNFLKKITYKMWDLATLGKGVERKISGFNLRLPTRYANYFWPDYEEDNMKFMSQHCRKGGAVIDVGAHMGIFAIRAGQLVGNAGKVYAFEPTPQTFQVLSDIVRINGLNGVVEPRPEAVADTNGITYFNVSDIESDFSNSLVNYRTDKRLHQVEVQITSIDNFLSSRMVANVDFIKIDAEGFEYSVLQGAAKTFHTYRPTAILSLHPVPIKAIGHSLHQIWDLCKSWNYKLTDHQGKEIVKEVFVKDDDLFDVYMIP